MIVFANYGARRHFCKDWDARRTPRPARQFRMEKYHYPGCAAAAQRRRRRRRRRRRGAASCSLIPGNDELEWSGARTLLTTPPPSHQSDAKK